MLNFNPSFSQEMSITFTDVQKAYSNYGAGALCSCQLYYATGNGGNTSNQQSITISQSKFNKLYYNNCLFSQITVYDSTDSNAIAIYYIAPSVMRYYRIFGSGGKANFLITPTSTGFTIPSGSLPSGNSFDFEMIILVY